jgi:hypothetical protein
MKINSYVYNFLFFYLFIIKMPKKTPRKTPRMTQEQQLVEGLERYAREKAEGREKEEEEYQNRPFYTKIYDAIKSYFPKMSIVACISFAMYLLSTYTLDQLFSMDNGILTFSANLVELYIVYKAYKENWFGASHKWFGKQSVKKRRVPIRYLE